MTTFVESRTHNFLSIFHLSYGFLNSCPSTIAQMSLFSKGRRLRYVVHHLLVEEIPEWLPWLLARRQGVMMTSDGNLGIQLGNLRGDFRKETKLRARWILSVTICTYIYIWRFIDIYIYTVHIYVYIYECVYIYTPGTCFFDPWPCFLPIHIYIYTYYRYIYIYTYIYAISMYKCHHLEGESLNISMTCAAWCRRI